MKGNDNTPLMKGKLIYFLKLYLRCSNFPIFYYNADWVFFFFLI
jgi:hypothetical protein